MHHQLPNRKRTLNLLLRKASGPGKFCVLSQIEPQTPHLVVFLRQFLQVSILQPYFPQSLKPSGFLGTASVVPAVEMVSFKAQNKTVSDHRLSLHFRPWPTGWRLSSAFAPGSPSGIILFHLSPRNTNDHAPPCTPYGPYGPRCRALLYCTAASLLWTLRFSQSDTHFCYKRLRAF